MNGTINLKDIITTAGQANQEDLLGKMVYYSLSDVLIDRAEFEKIRAACNVGGAQEPVFPLPMRFVPRPEMLKAVWRLADTAGKSISATTNSERAGSAVNW